MEINVNKGANWTFNQFLAVDQKQGVPWQIGKTEAISSAMTKIEMAKDNFLQMGKNFCLICIPTFQRK